MSVDTIDRRIVMLYIVLYIGSVIVLSYTLSLPYGDLSMSNMARLLMTCMLSAGGGVLFALDRCVQQVRLILLFMVSGWSLYSYVYDSMTTSILCVMSFFCFVVIYRLFNMRGGRPTSTILPNLMTMHYSVGAIVLNDNNILMIDRVKKPFGWACVAGHMDFGESPENTLKRELEEESGLMLEEYVLIHEERANDNVCRRGVHVHHWRIYRCTVSGTIDINTDEVKAYRWIPADDIGSLALEPVWAYWFGKTLSGLI